MSILCIKAFFQCDGCDRKFSVELSLTEAYQSTNMFDNALGELNQEDHSTHLCEKCYDSKMYEMEQAL